MTKALVTKKHKDATNDIIGRKEAYRENIDAHAASTDGRATFYVNGQTHMFERKVVIKKTTGGFSINKKKTIYFFFSYLKRYLNMYTFLKKQNHLFFLFLPKTVFEHVYISTLPHSCTVVKQYKELTTKILSRTFLILAFLTINPSDHGQVNLLLSLVVISQLLIKLLNLSLEGLLHGLLRESAHHLSLREIFIQSNGSIAP
jgi:hypothetical protein